MSSKRKQQLLFGVLAISLFMCLGWVGFRSRDDDHKAAEMPKSGSPGDWQKQLVRRGLAEIKAEQGDGLTALTALHGPVEDMSGMRQKIKDNLNGVAPLRLRFKEAQHVLAPAGVGLWIVEGAGVTCIFRDGKPASSCRTSFGARREGIWLQTYRTSKVHPGEPVKYLAVGVVPSGVRTVSVMVGSSQKTLNVRNNMWAYRADRAIKIQRLNP